MVSARLKYPSLLPLPTALLHLCAVELLAFYGFGGAAYSLVSKIVSHELTSTIYLGPKYVDMSCDPPPDPKNLAVVPMENQSVTCVPSPIDLYRAASLQELQKCLNSAVFEFFFSLSCEKLMTCPGCENYLQKGRPRLTCSDNMFAKNPQFAWIFVAYIGVAMSVFSVLVVLIQFMCCYRLGCASFGSGAYLNFTWQLERKICYKVCAYLMILYAAGVFLLFSAAAYSSGHFLDLMLGTVFDFVALFMSAKKTLDSGITDNDWLDDEEIDSYVFRRGWVAMLSQSNDAFEVILTEALWRASCQKTNKLHNRLQHHWQDLIEFHPLCIRLQHDESDKEELEKDDDEEELQKGF